MQGLGAVFGSRSASREPSPERKAKEAEAPSAAAAPPAFTEVTEDRLMAALRAAGCLAEDEEEEEVAEEEEAVEEAEAPPAVAEVPPLEITSTQEGKPVDEAQPEVN
jgi:hypothetical protein